MSEYVCVLCGEAIDLEPSEDSPDGYVPVRIVIAPQDVFDPSEDYGYFACDECAKRLERFIKSRPYRA